MEFKAFLRYWSLTLAVFVIYVFAFLAAATDIAVELTEQIRKKRASRAARGGARQPYPLRGRSIAETLDSPGQRLDDKRRWVHDHVATVLAELGIKARVLVMEDSMHHPFLQITDGRRMVTYRINKAAVEKGRAGDTSKIEEIKKFLRGHLTADFLGKEDQRPPRTTELAREAAAKPAPARPAASATATGAPTSAQRGAQPGSE